MAYLAPEIIQTGFSDIEPHLGSDPETYAALLPFELGLKHQAVVFDVHDKAAIIGCPNGLHEDILDHFMTIGVTALAVQIDQDRLLQYQLQVYGNTLAQRAEDNRTDGLRDWLAGRTSFRALIFLVPLASLVMAVLAAPSASAIAAASILIAFLFFRIYSARSVLPPLIQSSAEPPVSLPMISILIPLFKEPEVIPILFKRLSKLNYPENKLEVLVLLEAEDRQSHAAANRSTVPSFVRVLSVPPGNVQTKPRAMNFALPITRGQIIGVYDAEDAPPPKQLMSIAARFAATPALDCIQAPLDIYNRNTGLLPKLFAIEYAILFRRQNPTLAAQNLPLPLGGTSFFVRRFALERAGAWDAFNVTEDAELGFRLHKNGARFGMIAEPTFEEAPIALSSWIKQRSRWLKGFLLTFATLPKSNISLAAVFLLLGPIILATISALSLPLWLGLIGYETNVGPAALWVLIVAAIATECSLFAIGWIALGPKHLRPLRPYLFAMPLYRLLIIPAAIRAIFEAIRRPAYWDKTQHGQS